MRSSATINSSTWVDSRSNKRGGASGNTQAAPPLLTITVATNPKYPVQPQPRPRPQLVPTYPTEPPRSFKLLAGAVVVIIVAAVILVAVWLLKYGGGRPEEAPKPHQTNTGTPSGLSSPVLPRF